MTLKQFAHIVEIRTKIVSSSTLLLAILYCVQSQGFLDAPWAIVVVLAALLVDMSTTAFNTFFDFENKTDSKQTNRESDKVLVHEGVPSGYALLTAIGLFALGAVLGIVLWIQFGIVMFILGLLSFSAGFLYSGGPLPISRTPVGEFFAGGFLGSILFFVVCVSQGVQVDSRAFLASLPSLIHIAAILTVNNTCDIEGDRAAGRKTISILLGPKASRIFLLVELILAWAAIFLTQSITIFSAALVTVGLLASALGLARMWKRGFSHKTKGPSMGGISNLFLIFTIVYAAILVFNS